MGRITAEARRLVDQLRLLIAEWLILVAVRATPRHHPDSAVILEAADTVFRRPPV